MFNKIMKTAGKRAFAFLLMLTLVFQGLHFDTVVHAATSVSLEINGFQINTTIGAYRTVYSVIGDTKDVSEIGLVYGLDDYVSDSDMYVGSTCDTVYSYAATDEGRTPSSYSSQANSVSYAMTMKFIDEISFYSSKICVRAYVKYNDNTYAYSNISTASVYDIAHSLYQSSKMSNETAHNYLYNNILSKVAPDYEEVEYVEHDVVDPEPTSTQQQTEPPTEAPTTTSTVQDTTGPDPNADRPVEVFGEAITTSNGLITVVWGNPGNGQTFNVYLDGAIATDTSGAKLRNVICASYTIPASEGTHVVKLTGTLNGYETTGITSTIVVGSTENQSTTLEDGYVKANGDWNEMDYWSLYVASGWGGDPSVSYKNGGSYSNFGTYFHTGGSAEWSVQLRSELMTVEAGQTYTCRVTATSTKDTSTQIRFKEEVTQTEKLYTLSTGLNTFEITFTAGNGAQFYFDLGLVPTDMYFKITSFSLSGVQDPTTDPTTQPPTTEPPTTEPPTTQPETEETTTTPPKNIDLDSYYIGLDTASCSTLGSGNESADKLFDNNTGTKMYSGEAMNANNIRIAWKMKQAVILKSYTLTTGNDTASYSTRNPKKWVLYGSNDATTWIQIDIVDNGGMGAVNLTDYTYQTDIQDSYQFFAIQFTDNGGYYGFQLSEISMKGDVAPATADIGGDLGEYFAGIDSANNQFNGYNSETPDKLFDDDVSTKMFSGESLSRSLAWKMNRDVTLYSYSLTTANDNASFAGRLPKSWTLYGSTNGSNWVKLDRVVNSGMENKNYQTYTYTVNNVGTYKYFKIDFTAGMGNSFQLSEIDLYGAVLSPSEYDILFYKDWHLITTEGYVDELIKLFYNSYPRLYKRWGTGTEPKTITFMADSTYDGVAYCAGTTVCVSTTYANANPHDIGFFSHEITHSVQQYGGQLIYEDPGWWTENMANYGGFRYFHWSNPRYVQVYEASDTSLQNWGWQKYGNNKWFFAYMDAKYPTTKNADGTLNYGLIDSINNLIKNHTGAQLHDDPYTVGSPFNNVVLAETGYDCMESLRLRFVEELKAGTWKFTGFGDYTDNWRTEDIEGIPNPDYPMLGTKTHGNKTASELSYDVTSGTNLALNSKIYDKSGQVNASEAASMLVDGNLGTKWCATASNLTNPTYALNGVKHWVMLDLGSEKTFNTYTMYNTQSKEGYGNATEWEIMVSNDAKNWTSVDYQSYNNSAISSFNIGSQKARYVFIKVFTPDNGGPGTLRLYEFQLYNQ